MTSQSESILACLNSAFDSDPAAIQALCCNRVPCNKKLADHPFVPVDKFPGNGKFIVGVLGLLNGVLDVAGLPLIAVQFSEVEDENGCREMIGFQQYLRPHEHEPVEKNVESVDESDFVGS